MNAFDNVYGFDKLGRERVEHARELPMLKKIAIAITVLFGALLAFAATKPDSFRVERTTLIQAPPAQVFALIEDFHAWTTWSPWEKLDPTMKRTYSGAPKGKGAVYEWSGNDEVGAGRMEITATAPPSKAVLQLDFIEPFEGHNTAEFMLRPQGGATQVTWAMYGPTSYVGKMMSVFVSMDSLIGKDFEAGLANLKSVAEK